jgi:hypothetical protein
MAAQCLPQEERLPILLLAVSITAYTHLQVLVALVLRLAVLWSILWLAVAAAAAVLVVAAVLVGLGKERDSRLLHRRMR